MSKQIYSLILIGIFFTSIFVSAGTFTPSPVSPDAGPYTLSDIYNHISSSTYTYSPHIFTPSDTPNSTYFTLSDLWNIIPSHQTLTEGSLDSGILNTGIYPTTDLTTAEPNLIADNIATGTTMFGVVGRCHEPCPAGTPLTADGRGVAYDNCNLPYSFGDMPAGNYRLVWAYGGVSVCCGYGPNLHPNATGLNTCNVNNGRGVYYSYSAGAYPWTPGGNANFPTIEEASSYYSGTYVDFIHTGGEIKVGLVDGNPGDNGGYIGFELIKENGAPLSEVCP